MDIGHPYDLLQDQNTIIFQMLQKMGKDEAHSLTKTAKEAKNKYISLQDTLLYN